MSHEDTKTRSEPLGANIKALSATVVDAALKVHQTLGPGLLESVYETCMAHELGLRNILYERQLPIPVIYDGLKIAEGFRIDILVARSLVLEIKAAQNHNPLFEAQLLTYMKLTGCRLGVLINFSVPIIKRGTRRLAL